MNLHKNNNVVKHDLGDRLMICVERVGGKRALATAALISEAQLFRYVNGDTDVPSEKLVAIAKAAKVDAGWLLTGEGDFSPRNTSEFRPIFRNELMIQLVQLFEELLVEFEKTFSPRQRARALTFIYNALRHEETRRGIEFIPQKFEMLKYVNFLTELRTEEELDTLIQGMEYMEYFPRTETSDDASQLLRTWCNLIVRGMKGYYSSYAGKVYFERKSGGHIAPDELLELQNLVVELYKLTGKNNLDWLDLGCGNGQHLAHLAKHMPNLNLKGIELSKLGFDICDELMSSEKLPPNSVIMGDMRKLPYTSQSFDVIFSHLSMHSLPYLPGSGVGLEEVMSEVYRVLRPGGIAVIVMPEGHGRDYLLPRQFMNQANFRILAGDMFDVIRCTTKIEPNKGAATPTGITTDKMKLIYDSIFWGLIQKK